MTRNTAAIEHATRAIVYIGVEWSMPERFARLAVQAAIKCLPELGSEFFVVEEDGPVTGPWLISHGWTEYPNGCGSLLWFENGKLVAKELLPGRLGTEAIVRKTFALWGQPTALPEST